jgi:beta-N-acetylhexosaminidase
VTPVILGIAGTRLAADERAMLRAHAPRGVILFGRNIVDPGQLAALTAELRAALPAGAVLMVDQEGGRVARLRPPHWPALPAAGTLRDADSALAHGRALGAMVKAAGFDVAAAPVLDLRLPGTTEAIGDRALSDDPLVVARLGARIASGIMAEGVTPVMKHLPGHGRARVDSHYSLPRVSEADLRADLMPFVANFALPWAMTAHIVYDAFDPDLPATLSKTVIGRVIRGMIGFHGTLLSDDLAMAALTGTPAARAVAALAAGCDIALYCPGDMAGNLAVLDAVGAGA